MQIAAPVAAGATPRSEPAECRASEASPGLVNSQTTLPLILDPVGSRLRRLKRSILTAARMHEFSCLGKRTRVAMLTLTYRDCDQWRPDHLTDAVRNIGRWLQRRSHQCRYVWVAELQQRGALHYHVLVWLPRGLTLPKPDKQGWWPHGSTRIEWARKAVGYLVKYASKIQSKDSFRFPAGARLHGKGGLDVDGAAVCRWWSLPQWARELVDVGGAVRRKGCGLVERGTGVCLQSPWRVSRCDSHYVAERRFSYIGGLKADGPFSWLPGASWSEAFSC